MERALPSERTKEAIRAFVGGGGVERDPNSLRVRLGVEAMIEERLEAKVA